MTSNHIQPFRKRERCGEVRFAPITFSLRGFSASTVSLKESQADLGDGAEGLKLRGAEGLRG